jgi:hypothetical protein
MPVPVADAQLPVQPFGQGKGAFGPLAPGRHRGGRRSGGFGGDGGGGHWTNGPESVHPVVPRSALSMLHR